MRKWQLVIFDISKSIKEIGGCLKMAVNDREAIERMAKRLKAQADEVRALEMAIFSDYEAGMDLHEIAKKNNCTYKRVIRVLGKDFYG